MRKIQKLKQALQAIIREPSLLNLVIDSNHHRKLNVASKYGFSDGLPQADFKEVTQSNAFRLSTFAFLDGGSLPTDIALLKLLAESIESCSYFEIGTWRGESVVNVAETASECYTLNLPKEEMLRMNLSEKYADLHGFFSKGIPNITHLEGNSLHFNFAALDKKFDLIFIDGDHHYDMVKNDTQKVFQHLVHENSIVVWHDYAFNPEHVRFEVLEAILDGTPKEFHKSLYHVSHTMCAIYFPHKAFATKPLRYPSVPVRRFEVDIRLRDL